MMILNKSTLNDFEKKKEIAFENLSNKEKQKLWDAVRIGDFEALDELKAIIGEQLYNKWEAKVKEDNAEYYALSYFRNNDTNKLQKQSVLVLLYKYGIVVNDLPVIHRELHGLLREQEMLDIIAVLKRVTMFCVMYNRSGSHVMEILEEVYDIPKEISEGLIRLYNDNRIELKLDYIIYNLNAGDED